MPINRIRSLVRGALSGGWLRTGVWAISDQALFAGANFLVNVLLARWLPPEGYGAYTVAYTIFLLLGTIHSGFIVEPMLVYGSARFDGKLERYLRLLLSAHGRFSLAAALLFAGGAAWAWMSGQLVLGHALAAFAIGQSLILFQWMMRSACYIRTQPFLAATTGILYAALVVSGVVMLKTFGWLNEATGIGLMAGASLAAGTVIALRLHIPRKRVADPVLARDAMAKHREYGAWAASTGALEWFHGFLPFLLLPLWFGLAETGALRALFNLALPILHIIQALAHLLVPIFVRARAHGTQRRVAIIVATGLTVMSIVYAVAVEFGGTWVMHLLYEGKYDDYLHLLWIVAILPIFMAFSNVAQALLRSQERPEAVFAARGGASVVAATFGAALVFIFGVMGALLADLLSALTESLVMFGLLKRGVGPIESTGGHGGGTDPGRKHVLMVAFACSPGRGSEPGQGWQFARRMARHHDVTALVYSGFRKVIEAEMAARPIPGVRFAYYHLPLEAAAHHAAGVDRSGFREQIHYHLWNLGAGRLARRLHEEQPFHLAQHVSLMRYWSPSAGAALHDVPLVWGPVGGGENAPRPFYRSFSAQGRRYERLRDAVRHMSKLLPSVRRTARQAVVSLATTRESAEAMERLGATRVSVAAASVALDDESIERLGTLPVRTEGPVRFVAVGRLLHWKGYDLAIRAFARARKLMMAAAESSMDDAEFWIVGEGPERSFLSALAASLHVEDQVRFFGHVPRADCMMRISECDVLVHPSFHDSGGYATLEAMASGRAVICLNLGGPGIQVTPEVGVSIDPHTPEQTERDLAAAFAQLASSPYLRASMGQAGKMRVAQAFSWDVVIAQALTAYEEAVQIEATWGDTVSANLPANAPELLFT